MDINPNIPQNGNEGVLGLNTNDMTFITKIFQAGAWAITEVLFLYFILPIFGLAIVLKLLRLKGEFFKIAMGLGMFAIMYFFVKVGLLSITPIYQQNLGN